jgi:iron(III) transport system permease protein
VPAVSAVLPRVEPLAVRPSRRADGRALRTASLILAGLVALPLVVILLAWLAVDAEIWRHLRQTVLLELVRNTFVLVLGVGSGVLLIGVSLAWLTATCDFPGRRIFDWALMLPLAIPTYVIAFVMLGLLDFSGPLQSWLRGAFGPQGYWFPNVRSDGGIILVMTLALYPYVYMLARSAFLTQGQSAMEAARTLGLGPWSAFGRIALPMARPAIVAGLALALMETLADFGAVSVFNYNTFTTAIYKAWFGLFNLQAAAQLASLLMLFVLVALLLERRMRGQARYHTSGRPCAGHRLALQGWKAWAATGYASLVLGVAFIIPVAQLLTWAWRGGAQELDSRYLSLLTSTLTLGAAAAVLTVGCAFLLGYVRRHHPDRWTGAVVRFATLGYALPGAVLAVGIMMAFVWIDHGVASVAESLFGVSMGLVLSGTVIALLFAYMVRFLAVAYGPVDSSLERIKPRFAEAARSLGAGSREIVWRVYLPMLRPGLLTAALLVFVDVMKEMPATLMLRPFGWDTFAVRIFQLTVESEWERAALPALTLIAVGLLPVILLVRGTVAKH